ncbi:alpha/beta hydrolase [Roseobacter sp. HKCCA0434]|uniref:alpha/beta hydrolase n=1 Tax=Roseobacter sp. HKCCA0434 TaxID=3079297 RepID=UPI002905AB10|nr:alpha/beta fold hydrolase [Roseobacter sp. HKCCA0434]
MRYIGYVFILLAALVTGLLLLGPREPVDGPRLFDEAALTEDLDTYLAAREGRFDDIVPGVEKRIVWAGEPGAQTTLAIVYIHGFSATSQEIRPVPDEVAEALGANLYYTRLAGHGRGAAGMEDGSVPAWRDDYAEAIAIGRRLGERVIVMGVSTGGTVAALGLFDREVAQEEIAGAVMISPNFKVANPAAGLLTLPFARAWVPMVAGEERSFEAANEDHARYWTTTYSTRALLPMAASVQAAGALPFGETRVPALFLFSDDDTVVDHSVTREVAEAWGGPVTIENPELGEGDDPNAHVIAGDILSPGQTDWAVDTIVAWIATLGR